METDNPTQEPKITEAQFRSIHKWFGDVAKELRKEGKTMHAVLEAIKRNDYIAEMPVSKEAVKSVAKMFMEATIGKNSTLELSKKEDIDILLDTMTKFFGQEMGVTLPPFPSMENLMDYK
jgi:hypothetical protein